jgi:hypothetical protein
MGEKSGSGIQNLFDPGSRIRDGKIRTRDKHPGSAPLLNIVDNDITFKI